MSRLSPVHYTWKGYTYGAHRLCNPEETLQVIQPRFARIGITRLADITGLDRIGIPVCMAVRPNSKSLSVSQGKGMTPALAKVSAAMESIEAYHAENPITRVTTASYFEISQQALAANPYELYLHPRTIYHENLALPWVEGWDLMNEEAILVPFDLVHTIFLSDPLHLPIFKQSSTGLASGNHQLEAISHAICEVVERDATMLWQIQQTPAGEFSRLIDQHTINSPPVQELIEHIHRANAWLYLWEQTSDVGIPCFGCILLEGDTLRVTQPHGVFGGYGAHLSKEIALIRAITEAVQARLTYIAGARDDLFRSSYSSMQASNQFGGWQKVFAHAHPSVDYRAIPSLETGSFNEDVHVELALLRKAGFEHVIVVDLTQFEFNIPVVRVIIPGAEFFYEKPPARLGRRSWSLLFGNLAAKQAHH